ncbi:hypothetical protein BH24ACT21_BH24ACT21_06960 [soil metagenome]
MNGDTANFFGAGARRFSGFSPYAVGLSLIYLFWSFLTNTEAHVGVEYGFSLLATLGAVGCLGHLVAYVYRGPEYLSSVFSVLGTTESLEVRQSGSILFGSADWPLLVALLFGPFFVLLAGLGGWV